ncbi:MAG: tRNA uridine(34) 5-carboxymethylaminomethyl modification radical SAM/GNAT enzyme Elp3 [Thermoplasmata archaeon]
MINDIDISKLIAKEIRENKNITREEIQKLKMEYSKRFHKRIPKNSEILDALEDERDSYRDLLVRKPSRTLSGVAVVAAMTSPFPCPHGKCIYCPGGVEYNTAQSYTGREPAALRAIANDYDPTRQVRARIEQLNKIGHATSKIDGIVMGGTITARPESYQEYFVKGMYDAMNGFESENLMDAKNWNEFSKNRMIGLTFETRPDWFYEREIDESLKIGVTRVELGVQTVFDDILNLVRRGHGQSEVIRATRLARDAGLKIGYHMMPGLPGSSPERDLESFKTIFENENYRPDMIKIYPTVVVKNSELYNWWKEGKYRAYDDDTFLNLLVEIKKIVPKWVRIQRVARDIPVPLIIDGIRRSDIRDLAYNRLKENNSHCRCIRCREIGRKMERGEIINNEFNIQLLRTDYRAGEGIEIFLSFEDLNNDAIIGYLRLRKPSDHFHRHELFNGMIVRELKVLGEEVPVGYKFNMAFQHRGYGRKLMEAAEDITKNEFGYGYLLVNSGSGAVEYYRKLGYEKFGVYVRKKL